MYKAYSPYHPDELSVLIHSYLELRVNNPSAFVQVRLMDLSRCFKMLSWHERHALFLYGICRLTSREVAALLELSHTHVLTHYQSGKDRLLHLMNGGD
jgi:DNA-directed RNA polymerase specialized sigma24 family protein